MWQSQQLLYVRICFPWAGKGDLGSSHRPRGRGGGAWRVKPEPTFPQKSQR